MSNNPSYTCKVDTGPSLFVLLDPSDDHQVDLAVVGSKPIGVSHEGTREAPIPSVSPLAAEAGEQCRVYGLGETCEVKAAEAITAGDFVRPGASSTALKARHGLYYGGIAQADAAINEQCRIQVLVGVHDNSATVTNKTQADTPVALVESECGATFTTVGATGTCEFDLPAALVGMEYKFQVGAAQELRIDPDGTETIALPSTGVQGAAGKYLTANAADEGVWLRCNRAGEWDVVSYTGTWAAEA